MKTHSLVIWLLVFSVKTVFAQETPRFYRSENHDYFMELSESGCVLYEILEDGNLWDTRKLVAKRDFNSKSDSLGIIYFDQMYAVSYDDETFRVAKLNGRGNIRKKKQYTMLPMDDPAWVYEAVNREYWSTIYGETLGKIQRDYPEFNSVYYLSYHRTSWPPLNYTEAPSTFVTDAQESNRELLDSLTKINERCLSLKRSIRDKLGIIRVEELKTIYVQFPLNNYEYENYVQETINMVAEQRPDLFFELVEKIPTDKEYLFSMIHSKEVNKSLRAYQTKDPVKKEYFKYKHINDLKNGLIVTAYTIVQVGLLTGMFGIIFS